MPSVFRIPNAPLDVDAEAVTLAELIVATADINALVHPDNACPACGNNLADLLIWWRCDGAVICHICQKEYTP